MNHFFAAAVTALLSLTASAAASAQTHGVLEAPIEASAAPGDAVVLGDKRCRYLGQLVRTTGARSGLGESLVQAAGADTGRWHIAITRRACDQLVEPFQLRVDLPHPPSLTGGGGVPPSAMGYQVGTRFTLLAK